MAGYMGVRIHEAIVNIDNDEDDKSPTWEFTTEGMTARRSVRIAWSDAFDFCSQICGSVVHAGGTMYDFHQGHRFPYKTKYQNLRATKARIRRFGGSTAALVHADSGHSKLINHSNADVEIDYAPQMWEIMALVEETFDPSMEYLTHSNRKLYWDAGQADELKTDEAPGVIVHQATWVYTLKRWPHIPSIVAGGSLEGKINQYDVDSLRYNMTFPARTLLYIAPDMTETIDYTSKPIHRLTYQLLYKDTEWNKSYKAGSFTPAIIYNADGTQEKTYQEADLRQLFIEEA